MISALVVKMLTYQRTYAPIEAGALAPNTDVALALFPPILVLMIIFNGLNIAEASAPRALRALPRASFIRWASEVR